MGYPIIDAPETLEKTVIYEAAVKSFTSPDGPETGNFSSIAEKMGYLEQLGVNTLWLSGHQLCHDRHFYNIWTEYACIRPDELDPGLGTEEDFKRMVSCAHDHGIKVLLDVITHGVMADSPLVMEHPKWFKGGSWGMTDFDWYGGHPDLDMWWIDTWCRYVEDYGIDGFRLDVAHYRNDLWAQIRKRSREAGKEIIIIAENGPAIRGVVDVIQQGETVGETFGEKNNTGYLQDVAGYCLYSRSRKKEKYEISILYTDNTEQSSEEKGGTDNQGMKVGTRLILRREDDKKEEVTCDPYEVSYISHRAVFRVAHADTNKEIRKIVIKDAQNHAWNSELEGILAVDFTVDYENRDGDLHVEIPLRIQDGQCMSVQLSCHDNGWEGFPETENPYVAQGSRYIMGYAVLLAPVVPIFMSGEEFDARYRPLPQLSGSLYGKDKIGQGRWLYGSWIDWSQLERPDHKAMLEDSRRMLKIRSRFSHLIKPGRMGEEKPGCVPVRFQSEAQLPVPYLYIAENKEEAVLVAANPSQEQESFLKMDLKEYLDDTGSYFVQILYGIGEDITESAAALSERTWQISKDKEENGGLLVLHISRQEPMSGEIEMKTVH